MSLPPSDIPLGAIRFNSDSQKLEYWMGSAWMQIKTFSPTLDGGTRGINGGGRQPGSDSTVIDFGSLDTGGSFADFGDLTYDEPSKAGCASRTRGLFGGGYGSTTNKIDSITIASTGNANDFGDLTRAIGRLSSLSSATRGVWAGGNDDPATQSNVIDFVTIASEGNANDFGDLTAARGRNAALASPTRGVVLGGYIYPGNASMNTIDFITIASTGNATDFGDLHKSNNIWCMGCSNSVRGVQMGGSSPSDSDNILSITIATTGNATLFGELTSIANGGSGMASSIRAVTNLAITPSTDFNGQLDAVLFATGGKAVDFGDLNTARYVTASFSNGHGGLG